MTIRYGCAAVLCVSAGFSFGALAAAPAAGSEAKWGSHVDVEGKAGSKRSLGEADLFMPIRQDADTLVFADLRGRFDSQSGNEGNFGVGVRRMQDSGWNLGTYGYWDRRRSSTGNTFEQLTLGAEALGRDWDFRVNGYLPQGSRVKGLGITSAAAVSGAAVQVTTTTREERALGGYDAEVGWRLPLFDAEGSRQLRLYAGGYHFSDSALNVTGPRVRAEYSVASVQGLWKGAQLQVGAEAQRDGVRGGQTFLGVRLRIPFGAERAQHLSVQEERMTAPIVRDVDIVSQSRVASTLVETATTTGGQTITVLDSATTTGAALPGAVAAAGANSTVILSGTFNTTATTTLQAGQTIVGNGSLAVKTASGYTASLALPGATIAASASSAVKMANGTTLSGLTISNTYNPGAAYAVDAQGINNVTIKDSVISAASTSGVNVIDARTTGNMILSGNTISSISAGGTGIQADSAVNITIAGNIFGTASLPFGIHGNQWTSFNAASTGNVANGTNCGFAPGAPTGSVGFGTITCQ